MTPWPEEAVELGVAVEETRQELGADLVGRLCDRGTEHGHDAVLPGPKSDHGLHGFARNVVERTFPARVAGSDDPGLRIREQHHAAIRSRDPDGEPGRARDDAVDLRALTIGPGTIDHRDQLGMHLEGHHQVLDPQQIGHAPPVFRHGVAIVLGTDTTVQFGIDALRNTALAREEGVTDAGVVEEGGPDHRQRHG